jgi:hypothetical protein
MTARCARKGRVSPGPGGAGNDRPINSPHTPGETASTAAAPRHRPRSAAQGRTPPDAPGAPPSAGCANGAPSRTRTCGQVLRRHLLYPLSYGGGTGCLRCLGLRPVVWDRISVGRLCTGCADRGGAERIPRWSGLIIAGRVRGRSDAGVRRARCCPLVTALLPQPLWFRQGRRVCPRTVNPSGSLLTRPSPSLPELHPIGWPSCPQGRVCPQLGPLRRTGGLWCSRLVADTGGTRRGLREVPARERDLGAGL